MGCIEMAIAYSLSMGLDEINRNMGCIEMQMQDARKVLYAEINRNMGCIEMKLRVLYTCRRYRLIETWDVLK